MRIEGDPGEQLQRAYLWLSRAEAAELRDALVDMLGADVDASWHAHISSDDYKREITISLDDQ